MNVLPTSANTPIGANRMTHIVIMIITSCTPSQKLRRVSPPGPVSFDRKYPNTTPTKISARSCVSTAASRMFDGTAREITPIRSATPRPSTLAMTPVASGRALRMAWADSVSPGATTLTSTRPVKMAKNPVMT